MITLEQRKKTVHLILKDIVHLGSLSCGRNFYFRVKSLKLLQNLWKDGFSVTVERLDTYTANALDDIELQAEMDQLQIQGATRKKQATVPQKRKILLPFANELTQIASSSEAYEFDCKVYVLKNIERNWRSNTEILLKTNTTSSRLGAYSITIVISLMNSGVCRTVPMMNNRFISDLEKVPSVGADSPATRPKKQEPKVIDENTTVDDITSPMPIITRGRPSQALLTTPGKTKTRKGRKKNSNL